MGARTDSHFEQGIALLKAGKLKASQREFAVALEAGEDERKVRWQLALVHQRAGRFAEAVSELRQALSLSPDSYDLTLGLGLALGKTPAVDEAMHWLTASARLAPDEPDPWANIAALLLLRKHNKEKELADLNRAGEILRWALERWPRSAGLLLRQAEWCSRTGDTEGAIKALKSAIEMDSEDLRAYTNLYLLLRKQHRWREAWRTIERRSEVQIGDLLKRIDPSRP